MSGEVAAPAPEPNAPAPAPSELQPNAQAPADGGGANADANANAPEPAAQEPTPEEQNKKRERFDRRFSELSRAAREAEIRAARLEGELNALRHQRQPEPQAPAPVAQPEPAPNPSNYKGGEYDVQYIKDHAKWEAKEAVREALAEEARQRTEAERAKAANAVIEQGRARLETTLSAAEAEASGENGEHFQNAPGVLELAFKPVREGGLPRHVVDLITESDNPVHVAEVLGRQPERLAALRQMNPIQAAKHLGALDSQIGANLKRLAAQPAQPAKPAPQPSPAPIPTVQPTGAAPTHNPEKMSMAEYAAWRNAGGGA